MNKIFKIFTASLSFIFITLTLTLVVNAKLVPRSNIIKSFTPVQSEDLNGVASLNTSTITTYNKGEIKPSKLAEHNTYWIEPNESIKDSDLRVVNYTSGTEYLWQGKKPSELAKIYERENPGWIVVGGINGDFFNIGDNCEIINISMQEGEMYKNFDWNEQGHGALGFFEDGRVIYGRPDTTDYQLVEILDEKSGKYEPVGKIDTVDWTPGNVTLLTRFAVTENPYKTFYEKKDLPYDLSGYKVLTIKYDIERQDRSTHHVYIKGEVVARNEGQKTYEIDDEKQYSYLCYKDGSLDSIKIGDKIRCQYEFENAWEGVTNAVGYYNQVLQDGNVVPWDASSDVNQGYVNPVKNRTLMGFKPDGTPIMMVVDKFKLNYGASYEECGAILKSLGCVNGFLFDGGGSSSIFKRDVYGDFVTLNDCQDGNERRDGNAILFVMRDPGFKVNVSDETYTTAKVTIDVKNEEYFKNISNLRVKIDGRTYPYKDGGVIVDGLKDNSLYNLSVEYDIPSYKKVGEVTTGSVRAQMTTYELKLDFDILETSKTSITVGLPHGNGEELISNVKAYLNDKEYKPGEDGKILIDDLEGSTSYKVSMSYDVDAGSGVKYTVNLPEKEVKTNSYELPTIKTFKEANKTETTLRVEYDYIDYDNVVVDAYIVINGEKISLKNKSGKHLIKDLDFANNTYEIKLVLECEGDEKAFTIESEVLRYEKPATPAPEPAPEKKGCGCKKSQGELLVSLLSSVALLGIVLRKNR